MGNEGSIIEARVRTSMLFGLILVVLMSGCASTRHDHTQSPQRGDVLQAHLRYLASSELNGRKPMSSGSIRARRYIARQFKEAGLVPWGDAKDYVQSIGLGKNIVGVLPGSDPDLAREVILVSAHCDHLGDGRLGATDNASGVAILLELVRALSSASTPCKRSVCFASFDAEEMVLWGSMSFTRRADFDPADIVAVVNLDVIGRDAFDCMDKTLFMGRTHAFPMVREATAGAARGAGVQLLPYHAMLPGPRSDHFTFMTLNVPALFFSSGPFGDYHSREDTVDKLDWGLVRSACDVVEAAVRELACDTEFSPGLPEKLANQEDLQTLRTILQAHLARPDADEATLHAALDAIDGALSANPYVVDDARRILPEALLALGPQMDLMLGFPADTIAKEDRASMAYGLLWQLLFLERHGDDLMAMYRRAAGMLLEGGSAISDNMPPNFGVLDLPLRDEEVAVVDLGEGQYHLGVALPEIEFGFLRRRWRPIPGAYLDFGWQVYSCRGSRDDLIDYCLLRWQWNDYREEYRPVWSHILNQVAPSRPTFDTLEAAMKYRIEETGCADLEAWAQGIVDRKSEWVFGHDPARDYPHFTEESVAGARKALLDPDEDAYRRARLLSDYVLLNTDQSAVIITQSMLADLVALTDDVTPIPPHPFTTLDLPEALENGSLLDTCFRFRSTRPEASLYTIGEAAHKRLEEIARAAGKTDCNPDTGPIVLHETCAFTMFPEGGMEVEWSDDAQSKVHIRYTHVEPDSYCQFTEHYYW